MSGMLLQKEWPGGMVTFSSHCHIKFAISEHTSDLQKAKPSYLFLFPSVLLSSDFSEAAYTINHTRVSQTPHRDFTL